VLAGDFAGQMAKVAEASSYFTAAVQVLTAWPNSSPNKRWLPRQERCLASPPELDSGAWKMRRSGQRI
jgi:hypothetical protein